MAETNFSMNSWRHQLSEQVGDLRDLAQAILDNGELDRDELKRIVGDLICSSNHINQVVLEGDHHFSDMSDVLVEHLDD